MIIYKVTNSINGKLYIGQTTKSLDKRKAKHLSDANHLPIVPFHKALSKYGKDCFKWETLEECSSQEELKTKEQHWIKKLNTFGRNGYNMTKGGDCPPELSPKCRNSIGLQNSDKTIYTFKNVKTQEEYVGTRRELVKKFCLNNRNVQRLFSSNQSKHAGGWYLKIKGLPIAEKGIQHFGADKKSYTIVNYFTKKELSGTTRFLSKKTNIPLSYLCHLTQKVKVNYLCKGWYLKSRGAPTFVKPPLDRSVYTFKHKDGEVFVGEQRLFRKKFGIPSSSLSEVINKKRETPVLGWTLATNNVL